MKAELGHRKQNIEEHNEVEGNHLGGVLIIIYTQVD